MLIAISKVSLIVSITLHRKTAENDHYTKPAIQQRNIIPIPSNNSPLIKKRTPSRIITTKQNRHLTPQEYQQRPGTPFQSSAQPHQTAQQPHQITRSQTARKGSNQNQRHSWLWVC
jgi:hypothetical protein